jgi:putative NADH-flavin reductase
MSPDSQERPVKLALLGATGFVGAEVLRAALAAGLQVTALVRDPSRLPHQEGLEVVQGDARDPSAVDRTVAGAQAVISVLGTRRGEKTDTDELARMMRNVLAAMEHHGVRRLVAISGAGIAVPGERKPFPHNLISGLVRVLARGAVDAKQREFEVLTRSSVDWTAVRATRVVDGSSTGRPRVGTDAASIGMRVTRGDLAAFMVTLVTDGGYVRQAPFISSA